MPSIVPTQGRMVLCYHPEKWQGALPGIIIQVYGNQPESLINVKVFNDGRNFNGFDIHNMMSVRVYDPTCLESVDCPDGYCTWMPFQVGQAARTEAAESLSEARVRQIIRDEIAPKAQDAVQPLAPPDEDDEEEEDEEDEG